MHYLSRLLIPLLFLLAALLLRETLAGSNGSISAILPSLPYILLGIGALIALLVNHARELALSIGLTISYWIIQSHLQTPLENQPTGQIFTLLSLLTPLYFLGLLIPEEKGWRHPLGIATILGAPFLLLIVSRLLKFAPEFFLENTEQMLNEQFLNTRLGDSAGYLYLATAVISGGLLLYRRQTIDGSLLGCTLMSFVTLGWLQLEAVSSSLYSGMAAMLIVTQLGNLLNISFRDELTQIGNRRALLQAAKAAGSGYTLALLDADHFKKINDKYGHDIGDQALQMIAAKMAKAGGGSHAFRYGGEEFCLLFKGKTADQTAETLEALRKSIAEYRMVLRNKPTRPRNPETGIQRRSVGSAQSGLHLTVSIGVADSEEHDSFDAILKAADKALYKAKSNGRNQVVTA